MIEAGEDCFAQSASRAASLAARLLGWRPAEFWRATPSELATSLADPFEPDAATAPDAPSRAEITRMMERDTYGR